MADHVYGVAYFYLKLKKGSSGHSISNLPIGANLTWQENLDLIHNYFQLKLPPQSKGRMENRWKLIDNIKNQLARL